VHVDLSISSIAARHGSSLGCSILPGHHTLPQLRNIIQWLLRELQHRRMCSLCLARLSMYFINYSAQCNCKAMYYLAQTTGGNPYCDRCFVGCKTCSGPESTSCLSCVSSFTHDSITSTCTAPSTSNDYTIQNVYNFLGFGILTNWNW